ncbi:MAG TPA: hypothetical protein VJO35_01815 [Terriglobales bacterium]|nr:hypothetical protein [Terriglobales bacterium]
MSSNVPLGLFVAANRCGPEIRETEPENGLTNCSPEQSTANAYENTYFSPVELGRDPDLWLYRERTVALLRRYLRLSIEVGRLPSLLGRELFRSKVTSYQMSSFEDAVIFVHDVERVLDQLDALSKDLVAMIIFQDYSHEEAADVLCCTRRTVLRLFPEALDTVSELFLEGGLLNQLPVRRPVENSCQEGENGQISASACKQAE